VPLRLYYLLAFGGLGLYLPFFPSWLVAQGFAGAEMSALVSLVPFLGFFSPPLVGMLADGFGLRGRLMTITCTISTVGLSSLALANATVSPLPFVLALLPMVIFATFRAPMIGLADALLLEQTGNFGRVRLFGSLGFLLASGGLGLIVDVAHPFQLPLLIAALFGTCALVSLSLPRVTKAPPRPALKDARALLSQPGFRWLLACVLLSFLSHSSYDLCASLRLRDLGESERTIGAFWAIGTLAEIFVMYSAHGTIHRLGPGRVLSFALVVHALRWLFLSQAESTVLILALQPLHAITFALMWLSLMATLRLEVRERGMATGQGLLAAATAAGNTIGMWIWGLSYGHWGSSVVFIAAAGVAIVGALAALILQRTSQPATVPPLGEGLNTRQK
jgi:PPP family 3-phenylpropionic acid transporter